MKKNLFTSLLMSLTAIISMAQATSLTIDCQTPGWLSSMINYGDQQTVIDLKVTGYINSEDLKFIGTLIKDHTLNGCIDLEDVEITPSNIMGVNSFDLSKVYSIRKIIMPRNLISSDRCFNLLKIDTLIAGGEKMHVIKPYCFSGVSQGTSTTAPNHRINNIIFRGGVDTIAAAAFGRSGSNHNLRSIQLPSSLKYIGKYSFNGCVELNIINFSNSIEFIGNRAFYETNYYPDTLLLPESLKRYYTTTFPLKEHQIIYIPEGVNEIVNNYSNYNNSTNTTHYSIYLYFRDVEVHIKAKTPPKLYDCSGTEVGYPNDEEAIFSTTGYSVNGSTIYVPKGTKELYESTFPWSNATIVEETVISQSIDIQQDSITLIPNESIQLIASVFPENADTDVIWESSNSRVAAVDTSGVVLAKNRGIAIVYASTTDGSNLTDSCIIIVAQPVDGVTIEKHSLSLNVGDSEQLYANVMPVNADNKNLIWTSSNSEIAEVGADGNVTAKKCGVAFVKATSQDNPNASDSCKVTVQQPVTGITLNYNTVELHEIGETIQLVATVLPEDATNKEVRWASSNQSVCMVGNGTVVAVGFGTSVIIATTVDGSYMATCTVTVVEGADLPGDVNHDGEVNIADINAIINILLGKDVDGQTIERADVNGDGEVNIADANAVIKIIQS